MPKLVALILGALAVSAAPARQQPPAGCDMRRVERGYWCEKCDKTFEKDKLIVGKCPVCATKAKVIEMCVKKTYQCCAKNYAKAGNCAVCKKPVPEKVDKCRILYRCDACLNQHPIEGELKHDLDRDKAATRGAKVERRCERNGTAPHTP